MDPCNAAVPASGGLVVMADWPSDLAQYVHHGRQPRRARIDHGIQAGQSLMAQQAGQHFGPHAVHL